MIIQTELLLDDWIKYWTLNLSEQRYFCGVHLPYSVLIFLRYRCQLFDWYIKPWGDMAWWSMEDFFLLGKMAGDPALLNLNHLDVKYYLDWLPCNCESFDWMRSNYVKCLHNVVRVDKAGSYVDAFLPDDIYKRYKYIYLSNQIRNLICATICWI